MLLVFLFLSYVGTYLAIRKVAGLASSVYYTTCTTLILSPALCYAMVFLTELMSGLGTGFAGVFVIAAIGLPLALLGLLGLCIGSLLGWVRLGTAATPMETALRCDNCGHPASEHRITAFGKPQLVCLVNDCKCVLAPDGTDSPA
jgi:hypothetical protein